jgi:hypothetical protein
MKANEYIKSKEHTCEGLSNATYTMIEIDDEWYDNRENTLGLYYMYNVKDSGMRREYIDYCPFCGDKLERVKITEKQLRFNEEVEDGVS